MHPTPHIPVALALGSNLGLRARNLSLAATRLALLPGLQLLRLSAIYETPPWGVTEQPPFLNAVLAARTCLSPESLLRDIKALEHDLGRMPGPRWGPRVIDVDILLYGDLHLDSAHLTIPHPRLTERQFVLVPLAEIAPHVEVAPGTRAADLARPDDPAVRRLGPLAAVLRQEQDTSAAITVSPS